MRTLNTSADADEARRAWMNHLASELRFSPRTVEAYGRDTEQLLAFLKDHLSATPRLCDLDALTPRDLRAYLAYRRQGDTPLTSRSLARALAAIRSFFRFLEQR